MEFPLKDTFHKRAPNPAWSQLHTNAKFSLSLLPQAGTSSKRAHCLVPRGSAYIGSTYRDTIKADDRNSYFLISTLDCQMSPNTRINLIKRSQETREKSVWRKKYRIARMEVDCD